MSEALPTGRLAGYKSGLDFTKGQGAGLASRALPLHSLPCPYFPSPPPPLRSNANSQRLIPTPPPSLPPLRSKDNSLSEEIDRVASAVSRCNENVQLKRDLVAKNERAMQNIDYEGGEAE